jgi:ELWxxDGT repeat protein
MIKAESMPLRMIQLSILAFVLIAQPIPAAANGWVLFLGEKTGNGWGLWRTDGTPGGSSEIQTKTGMSLEVPRGDALPFASIDQRVIFVGRTAGRDFGLWLTDGTSAGTRQIFVNDVQFEDGSFGGFGALHGKLFFGGGDSASSVGLWQTDGTPEGTGKLVAKNGGPIGSATNFVALNDFMLFAAKGANEEFGLWRSDGTAEGTFPLSVQVANPKGLSPSCLSLLNKQAVLFRGSGSPDRFSLWRTDGTASGTKPIFVLGALNRGSGFAPCQFTSLGDRLLFVGTNGFRKRGLWISDGTSTGTSEIKVSEASAAGLDPWILFKRMGEVYFSGLRSDGTLGLWKTNGTDQGTFPIPTSMVAHSPSLKGAVINDVGLFRFGNQLWRTDGTAEGTHPVQVQGLKFPLSSMFVFEPRP